MERILMTSAASMALRAAALVAALAASACATGSSGFGGSVEPPPAVLPPPSGGAADALLGGGAGFSARDPSLDWGEGVLRPDGQGGFSAVSLPLFESPGGRHWGWLVRGQVYDRLADRTLPDRSGATVSVSGAPSWLTLAQDDGWLQIRYGAPEDRDAGLAWTRPDLAQGASARYVSWRDALDGAQGLVFRNAANAHNLRAEPSTSAEVVERLEGTNFDMRALEIRGDWMRVEVDSPPACVGAVAEDLLLGGTSSRQRAGWVFWRSEDRGPWVESIAGPRCAPGA
jgi:hypothetical protein